MNIEQEIAVGNRAELILGDVNPYFDMVESAILEKWKESPIADREGQHELRLMLKLLGDVKANIVNAIETGKLAKIQIERESFIDRAKSKIKSF